MLDSGATSSCISLRKAIDLNLKVEPTQHTATMVDSDSPLDVVGEVHVTFFLGKVPLKFSALVVVKLSVDILAGNNFLKENDVYSRAANNTISVGDSITVLAASPGWIHPN